MAFRMATFTVETSCAIAETVKMGWSPGSPNRVLLPSIRIGNGGSSGCRISKRPEIWRFPARHVVSKTVAVLKSPQFALLPGEQMRRYGNEGAYDEAIESLDSILKTCPQLKPAAAKKIEELTKELSLEAKIPQEHEIKEDLKVIGHELDPLDKMKKGFLEFKDFFKKEQNLFKQLAESQHPKLMIIACSDSRVDPATILGLDLGDAFIVRNVANMVPAYSAQGPSPATGSAIEYAVLHLKVEHIMVIGHSRCGGIKALMGKKDDGSNKFSEFIEDWVDIGKHSSKKVKSTSSDIPFEEQCLHCEKESVNNSLWNCLTFPFVKEAVEHGKLALHGAHYDFVNGSFEHWSVDFKVAEPEKVA